MEHVVQNCALKKTFSLDLDEPFGLPISGSRLTTQVWCSSETSEFPDGYAHLVTNNTRDKVFCHNELCFHCQRDRET